ncbi:response regulator [Paenibacillus lupini]|uniref:response regulator transcription factor n=1 Tax=Paenibacillus lupini TaxID=1450204 RepID=UPI00141E6D95|nr:response regulator [Paenibacillus lupini]NIK22384.1 two-component system response regulator YesN [Paenibacillus lupini]
MNRMLIVDDEKLILEGLVQLFTQESTGDLAVYQASSAIEALSVLARKKIDILLTDIRMPSMTGLQLAEEVRERWPDCRIIFLTGYHDFDYIYEAVKRGSVRYVLKSEGDARIFEVVQDTIQELEESLRVESLLQQAIQLQKRQSSHYRSLFLSDLAEGLLNEEEFEHSSFMDLNISLEKELPVYFAAARLDEGSKRLKGTEKDYMFAALDALCQRYLCPSVKITGYSDSHCYYYLFIQPKDDTLLSREMIHAFLIGSFETIQRSAEVTLQLPVSFALMDQPMGWMETSRAIQVIKLLFYPYHGEERIILTEKSMASVTLSDENSNYQELAALQQQASKVELYLESGQKEALLQLIEMLRAGLRPFIMEDHKVLAAYSSYSLRFLIGLNKFGLSDKPQIQPLLNMLMNPIIHRTWEQAIDILMELALLFFEFQSSQMSMVKNDVIGRLKKYIHQNLSGDLSLTNLSEQVYLNPEYMSRLFKQAEGVTLSDYITALKLDKAKEQLNLPNLYIQDIASNLGFSTAGYFTRFFKKETGLTPQEFRSKSL